MQKDGIIIAGTIRGGHHQQDYIISTEGICKCLSAGSHLNAGWMILIMEEIKYEQADKDRQPVRGEPGDRICGECLGYRRNLPCPNDNGGGTGNP